MADTLFTPEDMDAMRAQVRGIMDAEGLSQKNVADGAGIKYGTFTGWLAGTYQGNNERVAREVQIWLTSREETRRAAASVPRAPGFVETPSSARFLQALQYAHVMPEIAVIAGAAGIGKTVTALHYAGTHPNVWLATMDPSTAGVHGMLSEIAETMGVEERVANRLPRAIGRKMASSEGLLIVDEAQHLQTKSLDMLRSLYDRYGVGIGLIGNIDVYARLEGEGRKPGFAQLFSRVGTRVSQSRPAAGDLCALIERWGVADAEAVRFLKSIGRKPGGLRGMTKVLQLATMIAAGADETLALRHIRTAWERHTVTGDAPGDARAA